MKKIRILLAIVLIIILIIIGYIIHKELPYLNDPPQIPIIFNDDIKPTGMFGKITNKLSEYQGKCQWDQYRSVAVLSGQMSNEYIFMGGGYNCSDKIFMWDPDKEAVTIALEHEKPPHLASLCVAVGCVKGDSLEDIVIGRDDGIYILQQYQPLKFRSVKIFNAFEGQIPSCITLGDYDRSGYLSIYLANIGPAACNHLLKNIDGRQFRDASSSVKCPGGSNSAVFVDFNSNGYPDLLVAKCCEREFYKPDSPKNTSQSLNGSIILYKNIKGIFSEHVIVSSGSWMGIAIGECDNSGQQSAFVTCGHDRAGRSTGILSNFGRRKQYNILLKNNGDYEFDQIKLPVADRCNGQGAIFFDYNLDCKQDILYSITENTHELLLPSSAVMKNTTNIVIPAEGESQNSFKELDDYMNNTENDKENKPRAQLKVRFKLVSKFRNRAHSKTPIAVDILGDGKKHLLWFNYTPDSKLYIAQPNKPFLNVQMPRNAKYANCQVSVKLDDGLIQTRQLILGGTGLGSAESSKLQFALCDKKPVSITITLPDGTTLMKDKPEAQKTYKVEDFARI